MSLISRYSFPQIIHKCVDVRWMLSIFLFFGFMTSLSDALEIKPKMKTPTNLRREFKEGENALIMCVVDNSGGFPVMWSRIANGKKKVLTIDKLSAIDDERIDVLHDEAPKHNSSIVKAGGDVWVLSIKNISRHDIGGYICRVGSSPPIQTYYMVSVIPADTTYEILYPKNATHHNYTNCCRQNLVSKKCLSFCAIDNILDGNTQVEPEDCEEDFPRIVRCMADFRNHVPCCEKQGIPDICQDLCRGEYTLQTDYVKSHFSCTTYTEATLLCISEGIELLPRPPISLSLDVTGPSTIEVTWETPDLISPLYDHFLINVTTIRRFDPPYDVTDYTDESIDAGDDLNFVIPKKMQVKIPGNVTSYQLKNLSPLTWYEISVISGNSHGQSLALYKLRALTQPADANNTEVIEPELPDIASCCAAKGIKHERCLNNLCNPSNRYLDQADMIVCAVWSQEAFSCLADSNDNSDCCRQRGLPDQCVELCTGNVTKIDYNYFKCVEYHSDFRSCLLKGYGVLPGPPTKIQASNIHDTFVLLSWSPPELNGDSVTSYHAYYRPINPTRECEERNPSVETSSKYSGLYVSSSPYVVENLCPDTKYEVYLQAFNTHGTSDPSVRMIFKTDEEKLARPDTAVVQYNATECCRAVNVSPACSVLCNYNVRMSHYRALSHSCNLEMSSVIRCVVGGRDHTSCCKRRGVPASCMNLCTGSIKGAASSPAVCLPYVGNVMMCLEEGVGVIPGPVISLHATSVRDTGITLQWDPPVDGPNITSYQVRYHKALKFSMPHSILEVNKENKYKSLSQSILDLFLFSEWWPYAEYSEILTMNVTQLLAIIDGLETNAPYNFFVVSMNEYGYSLPSSMITINISSSEVTNGSVVAGVPSAPHSILLEGKTATSLMVIWQPPLVAQPTERFRFDLHYAPLPKGNSTPEYKIESTSATALLLDDLKPNTQYVIYAVATSDMGESRPSETLVAWTDPAYPAFVETPTVHPSNLIVEGRSMTVLCIAMGSPPPEVSLYISGVLVYKNVTRHMVTVVNNVTRDMTEISCYADNGYGLPMQSSITIEVSYRPIIEANEEVKVYRGDPAELVCHVQAWPRPNMVWWRTPEQRVAVIHGGNVSMDTTTQSVGRYVMRLTLKYATDSTFYCNAENTLGTFAHTVKVITSETVRMPLDASACCMANNVSSTCLRSCDFDRINFHTAMNREECIPDFPKLLKCGSDGSDHRGCCQGKNVPEYCLDHCRGLGVKKTGQSECMLTWAPAIFKCFSEGREILPGPPLNLRIQSISPSAAKISWDIPVKNPGAVKSYRVFWRKKGTRVALKNDTDRTSIILKNLENDVEYEFAVKAGNLKGTSLLTDIKIFVMKMPYISMQSATDSGVGVALGISMTVIILVGVSIFAWWLLRKRDILGKKPIGISFENPSYNREQSGEVVQIAETPNGSFNGGITNHNGGLPNGGHQEQHNPSNGIWNTQNNSKNDPGFDTDPDPRGKYKRFKS